MRNTGNLYTYEFHGYWKDVGTLSSYWEANMGLVDLVPEFNMYEEYWKIYTSVGSLPPQYMAPGSSAESTLIGDGAEIYGHLVHSVLGCCVTVGEGSEVRDSIIMKGVKIGKNVKINKAIIAENTVIADGAVIGEGEYAESKLDPRVYNSDLVTIDEDSYIPAGVSIGKNTAISGRTVPADYANGRLEDGGYIIKAGDAK